MIKVTLKDGKVLEVENGKTILEVAKQNKRRISKNGNMWRSKWKSRRFKI